MAAPVKPYHPRMGANPNTCDVLTCVCPGAYGDTGHSEHVDVRGRTIADHCNGATCLKYRVQGDRRLVRVRLQSLPSSLRSCRALYSRKLQAMHPVNPRKVAITLNLPASAETVNLLAYCADVQNTSPLKPSRNSVLVMLLSAGLRATVDTQTASIPTIKKGRAK